MKFDDLKNRISTVLSASEYAATFHFLLKIENSFSIQVFDLQEASQQSLTSEFKESLNSFISQEDVSILDLTLADNRSNAVYKYDLDLPEAFTAIASINDLRVTKKFNPDENSLKDIVAIIITIGTAESHITLYKHQYPVSIFKQDGLFARFRGSESTTFSQFKGEMIRINSTFEFIFIDDQIIVCDIKTLEKFYGFHDAIKNVAMQGIVKIDAKNLLDSSTPIASRLEEPSFAKKVARVAVDSDVLDNVPNNVIIEFTKTHPLLKKKFSYSEKQDKIILKTKVAQNLFIKLLNDDFLRSDLTKRYYDSLAKDRIENPIE